MKKLLQTNIARIYVCYKTQGYSNLFLEDRIAFVYHQKRPVLYAGLSFWAFLIKLTKLFNGAIFIF